MQEIGDVGNGERDQDEEMRMGRNDHLALDHRANHILVSPQEIKWNKGNREKMGKIRKNWKDGLWTMDNEN